MDQLGADDPRTLGPYELVARLGEGGQGVVYLGRDPAGRRVAVKLLHNGLLTDPGARARFLREVEIARRVARFSTAPVLHADLAGRRPYIVSEYVPGPSLRDLVATEGPRQGAALERLAISTAAALAAIHRAGVLHRDFKPANILMGPEGPVVIDFGIARALDAPGGTSTGPLMGTPSYLAPEQIGGRQVTAAADVFAWAVTMVFAASGRPAFGADSTPAVLNRILNEQPAVSGLTGALLRLVTAGLSKDPAARPSADDLVAGLTSPAFVPGPAAGSSAPPERPAGRRRHALPAMAAAATAALLVTGGVLITTADPPAPPPATIGSAAPPPSGTATAPAPAATTTSPQQVGSTPQRTSSPPATHRARPESSAPATRPTRTGDAVSNAVDDRSLPHRTPAGNTENPPEHEPEPEPPRQTTQPPAQPQQPSPMENPFTCIPSMC
ncbi:serine/threonine-protein kinase [Nonomuraea sp. NPDC049684]|uniref:serine/threonine-protein kinase n=1 Tax=Nonomuraea sp. NPDC049684 TaxID=3364356 RepID=UPI0037AB1C0A